jgi:hypothetical protein
MQGTGKGEGRGLTMGSPSVTSPTVVRRGSVIWPTTGRPFVVSFTVFKTLKFVSASEVDG